MSALITDPDNEPVNVPENELAVIALALIYEAVILPDPVKYKEPVIRACEWGSVDNVSEPDYGNPTPSPALFNA